MGSVTATGVLVESKASCRIERLLNSYLFNIARGRAAVREMIIQDIKRLSEMGAHAYAEDLRDVLFRFDDHACGPISPSALPSRRQSVVRSHADY